MNIGIFHGYGLKRSGSNIYVDNVAKSLSLLGHNVHIFCQESLANVPSYVSYYFEYNKSGKVIKEKSNVKSCQSGAVYIHRLDIDGLLPVYNLDKYPDFKSVKTFTDLSNKELCNYIDLQVPVMSKICSHYKLDIVQANHMVCMPELARRVKELLGIPFVIMPHGSSIEYTIKQDLRYSMIGKKGLDSCDGIMIGGSEMRARIEELWGNDYFLNMKYISTGVDTELFKTGLNPKRKPKIISYEKNGCSSKIMNDLYNKCKDSNESEVLELCKSNKSLYQQSKVDKDIDIKLSEINWEKDDVVVFAGKNIVGKGIHSLLVAISKLEKVNLVIAGEGTFREGLELLLKSITENNFNLFQRIINIGWKFDGKNFGRLSHLESYLNEDNFKKLVAVARKSNAQNRVIFVGYLNHDQLADLMKNCKLTVLPSIVKEAYPLSIFESLACGIFPLATNHGGSEAILNEIKLKSEIPLPYSLAVDVSKKGMVKSLVKSIQEAINVTDSLPSTARKLAEAYYSWGSIAKEMTSYFNHILQGSKQNEDCQREL